MAERVLRQRLDGTGVLQLNRPEALNALTTRMVQAMADALTAWLADDVRLPVVGSTSARAFSAGGDMRAVAPQARDRNAAAVAAFFIAEYALDLRLAGRHVPQVSLMDGICMGGGLGLAVHGAYRVVTERSVLAMPRFWGVK